jgi:uncharacterized protein
VAKPRPDFPPVSAIRALADAEGRLALRVTPGARTESIEVRDGGVQVKVRAKPTDGEANAAALGLLAEALGLPSSRVEMLRGATSRNKLVRLS